MKILLIEDEQKAGEKLKSYIANYVNDTASIEWVRSIAEVKESLDQNRHYDLIFSDIELLDGNVFTVYETMAVKSPIIFCTAYDQFYMKAFKTSGIAYLLKPYDKEQFLEAWNKYKTLFDKNQSIMSTDLINELKLIVASKGSEYKTRFTIKKKNGVILLTTEDIKFFQSQGDFVLAVDNKNNKHVINQSISKLISVLNPDNFFQINRSEIINVAYIEKFETHFKNRVSISMLGEEEKLYTANSRTPEFRNWVG